MKTTIRTLWNTVLIIFLGTLLAGQAHGQIYVASSGGNIGEYTTSGATVNASLISDPNGPNFIVVSGGNLLVVNTINDTIGEYDATTGATVNASLVSGLNTPIALALSGGNLFVLSIYGGTIGVYDATTGATVNASLVSGLSGSPYALALSGGHLFVNQTGNGTISEYDAITGAVINASLVSGLSGPYGIVVSGGKLYVANQTNGTIGVYDATTGATINSSLVSGLGQPSGLALFGGHLFVVNQSFNTIGEYDATTGAVINAALVSGLKYPAVGIVVAEPYSAQVQQPINLDGSSVFSVKRGVVPVKFTLTFGGVATCQLPPATISLIRTAGGVLGSIDESTYLLASDSGSNFRIDSTNCQYVYNLATSSLGPGEYTVSILINGSVVGSGTFGLK